MKLKITIGIIIGLLAMLQCSAPTDPVDRFILYMNNWLDILEKNKTDPVKAGINLQKYNNKQAEKLNDLIAELKRYNKDVNDTVHAQITTKLKPVIDRMVKLIEDQPTLLLDENVAKAFENINLGF